MPDSPHFNHQIAKLERYFLSVMHWTISHQFSQLLCPHEYISCTIFLLLKVWPPRHALGSAFSASPQSRRRKQLNRYAILSIRVDGFSTAVVVLVEGLGCDRRVLAFFSWPLMVCTSPWPFQLDPVSRDDAGTCPPVSFFGFVYSVHPNWLFAITAFLAFLHLLIFDVCPASATPRPGESQAAPKFQRDDPGTVRRWRAPRTSPFRV